MSNYAESESSVRVDIFKKSGKWSETRAVEWIGGYKNCCIHTAFEDSLKAAGCPLMGMFAVCLEPYHEHSHPILIWGSNE